MDFLSIIAKLDLAPIVYLVALMVAVYMYIDRHAERALSLGRVFVLGGLFFLMLLIGANLLMVSEAKTIVYKRSASIIKGGLADGILKVEEIDFTKCYIKAYYKETNAKRYILISFTDYVFGPYGLESYSADLFKTHWFVSLFLKVYSFIFILFGTWVAIPNKEAISNRLRKAKNLFTSKLAKNIR